MTHSIAARGKDALANVDEMDLEFESVDLRMKHSVSGPGAMKLSVYSDLLFGLTDAVFQHGLYVEAKLDVWDKRIHVAEGWLLNMDHPQVQPGRSRIQSLEAD